MSSRPTRLALAVCLLLASTAARADDPAPPAPKPTDPKASPAEPTTSGPAAKLAPPTDAERESVKRMVEELRAEVAKVRGLAWKHDVPADLISREEMRQAFVADLDEEYPPAKRERDTAILRRLGLLTPDQDPVALMLDFMESGVAGFYDPSKKHLRVIQGFVGDAQRPTIFHELIHALEDQYFDLKGRTKPIEDDGDRTFAEECLCEGSAEFGRFAFQRAHPDLAAAFRAGESDPALAKAQLKAFQKVPAFLFVPTLMHYQNGPAFVTMALKGGDYAGRMEALYKDPPVSQEQILHPRKWFGPHRDYPQAVVWGGDLAATAGEGWSVFHQMPVGELDLSLYLDFFLSPLHGKYNVLNPGATPNPAARRAAAGWDAGWTAYLKKEGLPLGLVEAWAFDTEKDAVEAAEALGHAAEKAAGTSWKSAGWKAEGGADASAAPRATLDYVNQHGTSRLLRDHDHLLRVDGVPPAVLDRLWPSVLKTAFVRDARDTWSPADEDQALAAATFRDEKRGVGVSVPSKAWSVGAATGANPNAVAQLQHAEKQVTVTLIVLDQSIPAEAVLMGAGPALKAEFPDFSGESAGEAFIGTASGLRAELGKAKSGSYGEIVLASGSEHFFVARLVAPDRATLDAVRADVEKILASVVARGE